MTVRDDRGDVKQTTAGFRGPLMVQSLTSAKSKFLSLVTCCKARQNRVLTSGLRAAGFTRVSEGRYPIWTRSP